MAKKKEDAPVKTDGWMSTFSDLMNLLLCFFVLLFAMSTVDAEKWQQLVASFSSSYSVLQNAGGEGLDDGNLIASGATQLTELDSYYTSLGIKNDGDKENISNAVLELEKQEMEESEHMGELIQQMLQNKGLESEIEVQVTQHYVCLNMKGSLLFELGSATLTDEAKKVLAQASEVLAYYNESLIEIEGHTDNIPINAGLFTSNNVLSFYRAHAVYEFLVNDCKLSPEMKHSGRGEFVPVASNDTAEGRAQNRRVEIKIYNSFSSK